MHIDKKKYIIDSDKNICAKIVQISDIHFSINYNLKRLDKVRKKIDNISPDYICIIGDLIDEYDVLQTNYINYFKDWLRYLSFKYKVIISLGNHDFIVNKNGVYKEHSNIDWLLELKSDSLIVLNNEIYKDEGINFIGYNPSFTYYYKYHEQKPLNCNDELSELIKNIDGYNILLVHTPSIILKNDNYKNIKYFDKIDLILCGHTHGGMVPSFVPGNFGIVSPTKKLFPRVVRGKVNVGTCLLIISSGIVKLSRKSKISVLNDIYGYNINVINIKKV